MIITREHVGDADLQVTKISTFSNCLFLSVWHTVAKYMTGRHEHEENQYPLNCLHTKQNKNLFVKFADSDA